MLKTLRNWGAPSILRRGCARYLILIAKGQKAEADPDVAAADRKVRQALPAECVLPFIDNAVREGFQGIGKLWPWRAHSIGKSHCTEQRILKATQKMPLAWPNSKDRHVSNARITSEHCKFSCDLENVH